MREYNINDFDIPTEDITSFGKEDIAVDFNGVVSVASKMNIDLDDTDKDNYNPFSTGSLFFGVAWWGKPALIYETEIENYVFKGKIKKVDVNEKNNLIKVTATSAMQDLIDTTCVYDNTATDECPAEAIKNILLNVMGLDEDENIDGGSFQKAIDIQTNVTAWVNVKFIKEDGKKCKAVIQELLFMSRCSFYVENEVFYLIQFEEWNKQVGREVQDGDVLEKNFEIKVIDEKLANDFVIKYDNAGTIATETGDNAASQANYGVVKTFNIPKDSLDSTTSADYKILYKNSAGAAWAGALAMDELKNMQYKCIFELDNGRSKWSNLKLNEQIDISFAYFNREPARVARITPSNNRRKIKIEAILLNLPVNVAVRDAIPPDPVELISLLPLDQGALVTWTKSIEGDHVGYEIFLTTTKGEWEAEFCNLGRSPIDVKNPPLSGEGYAYQYIRQLTNGVKYYFKIKSYDTRFNKSAFSNVLSVIPIE